MLITINISCENNRTHPIKLDISDWDNWIIVDSPCKKKYGKLFGDMTPCAQHIKTRAKIIQIRIIKKIGSEKTNKEKAIQKLKEIAVLSEESKIARKAIKEMLRFGEDAIDTLHSLLTIYDIEKQTYAAEAIEKLQEKKQIKIPKTTEYILKLIKANKTNDTLQKQNALNNIIKHNIYEAAPVVFFEIDEYNKNKQLYINAYLQLEPNALEKILQFLRTETHRQKEPAILLLEAIDPPESLDIACEIVNGFGIIESVAARIIKKKAKKTDIHKLIDILTQSNYTHSTDCACETIIKIYPTEAQNIFFEYIRNNPNMPDLKKRRIIEHISRNDRNRYEQNPLQVFDDFNPNEVELLEFLNGIQKNIHYEEQTKKKIIQAITDKLENDLPPHYDPFTTRYILERFT
ncbi:MAG: hypothetical protein KatS3mg087_1518 [Patescibacteria group bacterium]|nr:MAG: hypothetical protein KatS3mg087_1518 [Patescibacteria group bacterium]